MNTIELDKLFTSIKEDCQKLIINTDITIEDLAFALGISPHDFIQAFKYSKDFTFFMETYHILLRWKV